MSATIADTAPLIGTELTFSDRFGRLRMRMGIGRNSYRVEPGLYRVGVPSPVSPVLVTANYKLTFDVLRSNLHGVDAWILVLDTKGVNVWCAAGKGTFGTDEIIRRILDTRLHEVVEHRLLILPQLGAPGVAVHRVYETIGFRVVYGPVRAGDLPAFLEADRRTTREMRRVTFDTRERAALVGVEVVYAARFVLPAVILLVLWRGSPILLDLAPLLAALIAALVAVPLLLPWIPGRALALKGAIAGTAFAAVMLWLLPGDRGLFGTLGMLGISVVVASYLAMNFTGSTTYTSPSGVEREMRRALPWQIAGLTVGFLLSVVSIVTG